MSIRSNNGEIQDGFHRGSICSVRKDVDVEQLSEKERRRYSCLLGQLPSLYLVLKHINEKQLMLARVLDHRVKNCKTAQISGDTYWVRLSAFIFVPDRLLQLETGKKLDNPEKVVSAIYNSFQNNELNRKQKGQRLVVHDRQQRNLLYAGRAKADHRKEKTDSTTYVVECITSLWRRQSQSALRTSFCCSMR